MAANGNGNGIGRRGCEMCGAIPVADGTSVESEGNCITIELPDVFLPSVSPDGVVLAFRFPRTHVISLNLNPLKLLYGVVPGP